MSSETHAAGMKPVYLDYIKQMREEGIQRSERIHREWLEKPADLRGPEPRNLPGAQGVIDAFLYTVTGESPYAESAAQLLADNDHGLYEYIQAYREVSDSPAMTPELQRKIEERIARKIVVRFFIFI